MDSILREVFHFDMEDMKTNVDIVLIIDATKTMWSVWEMLESEALCFYDKLIKMVEADGMKSIGQLRVKVIWFRDFIIQVIMLMESQTFLNCLMIMKTLESILPI